MFSYTFLPSGLIGSFCGEGSDGGDGSDGGGGDVLGLKKRESS